MKKYGTLKVIVTLQAVSMIALACFVIWHFWPQLKHDEATLPAHDQSNTNAEDEVVAVIAEQTITRQQLVDELMLVYGDQLLQQMLEHYAIEIASNENNIVITEQDVQRELVLRAANYSSVDDYVRVMTEQVGVLPSKLHQDIVDELALIKLATKDITISDAEVQVYISENPSEFVTRYALGLEWIVVSDEKLAHQIIEKLEKGESFSQLAVDYSMDTYTAAIGGKLGLIEEDDELYPAPIRETAMALSVGSVAGPIALEDSYAIVKLMEKRAIKHITEDERHERVREQLALERAESLDIILERLIINYGSLIKKQKL